MKLGFTSNLNIAPLPLLKTYGFMNLSYNLCNYSSIFYCFKDQYFGFLHPLKLIPVFFSAQIVLYFFFLSY